MKWHRNDRAENARRDDQVLALMKIHTQPVTPQELARLLNQEAASDWAPVGPPGRDGLPSVPVRTVTRVATVLQRLARNERVGLKRGAVRRYFKYAG